MQVCILERFYQAGVLVLLLSKLKIFIHHEYHTHAFIPHHSEHAMFFLCEQYMTSRIIANKLKKNLVRGSSTEVLYVELGEELGRQLHSRFAK